MMDKTDKMDDSKQNTPDPTQTPTASGQGAQDPFPAASSDPPAAPDPTVKVVPKPEPPASDAKQPANQEQKKEEVVKEEAAKVPVENQIFTSDAKPKGKNNKGVVVTIVAILLLVGGVAAGVYLVDNQQLFNQKAEEDMDVAQGIIVQCSGVLPHDSAWNQLSAAELSALNPGDTVRFTVTGSTTPADTGTFDKAKFTINGVELAETTLKRDPALNEFYQEYTIPEGVEDFNVTGQIYHSVEGWI